MGAGRFPSRPGVRAAGRGFSLIELLVSISMLAILLGVALPSFGEWIRSNQLRSVAETLREGLQLARSEAVKRNTRVRLQLVSTLDNSCALSTTGPYWVVNIDSTISPAGACLSAISDTASPYLLQKSAVTTATKLVTVTSSSSNPLVAFDAMGRLSGTLNPTVSIPTAVTFALTYPGYSCAAAGGSVRCLNVVVYPAGEVRMCDPAQTSSTDPTRC